MTFWRNNFGAKDACKMLMKITPAVNFINVKHAHFLCKLCFGSFYYVHVTRKKAAKTMFMPKICPCNVDEKLTPLVNFANIFCVPIVQKMLMKVTPSVTFTNILQTAFALIFFCQKILKPNCKLKKSTKHFCTLKPLVKN